MSTVRIIGIGSSFCDDRIGWDAVEAIENTGLPARFPAGAVDTCCCDGGSRLLSLFPGVAAAILVDAVKSGSVPGAVHRLDAAELTPEQEHISSHGFGLADTLALGRELNLLPATLIIYGIEVGDTGTASSRDPKVADAIPDLLGRITVDLEALLECGQ